MAFCFFYCHIFTVFSDLYNNILLWKLLFFADLSTSTAIFDFVESTFCTILFFRISAALWDTMVAGSSWWAKNVRNSRFMQQDNGKYCRKHGITVILSKKQWCNADNPCDPKLHYWLRQIHSNCSTNITRIDPYESSNYYTCHMT